MEESKLYKFFTNENKEVVVSFYDYKIKISIPDLNKHYSFLYNDIESFHTNECSNWVSIHFLGKNINFLDESKECKISSFNIKLKKDKKINYEDIFKVNTALKNPIDCFLENISVTRDKLFELRYSDKALVSLKNCLKEDLTIYLDNYLLKTNNFYNDTFYFDIPYGEYELSYCAYLKTYDEDFNIYTGYIYSNKVKIKIDKDNREFNLKATKHNLDLKLELI